MYAIANIIHSLVTFYNWLILAYCLLSWFPIRQGGWLSDIAAVLSQLVDPFLGIFRRFMPTAMGIDFSPVLAVVVLSLLEQLVISLLGSVL
ncbi:MAG: YggT family protein [Coriobacteriaceae bacterium]|nr:YggT family protein [Coriobacteriaceae bacterium]